MRYAVFGPREYRFKPYENGQHVSGCLSTLPDFTCLISGGASTGVEALAEAFAKEKKITIECYAPNYLNDAGVNITTREIFDTRNISMLANADAVVVFWDGSFALMVPLLSRCMILQKKVTLYPMI